MIARKSFIFALILGVCAFYVLIRLGVWQLHRREWKADLLARLEQSLVSQPLPFLQQGQDATQKEFTRVEITGRFLPTKAFKEMIATPDAMRPFTKEGFGDLIFTPLIYDKGIIFVNRGFVPASMADRFLAGEEEPAHVVGLVRDQLEPDWITPKADIAARTFYTSDITTMAKASGLNPHNIVTTAYIEADPTPNSGDWPKGRNPRVLFDSISNRHLEYALTWFGIAAGLVGVMIVFLPSLRLPQAKPENVGSVAGE